MKIKPVQIAQSCYWCRSKLFVLILILIGVSGVLGIYPMSLGLAQDLVSKSTSEKDDLLFVGKVVAAPGHQAEIRVPATGIIYYATEPPKNVGEQISAEEPLCIIEYRFNYHDYAHLYTERWPLQRAFLEGKWKMAEAGLAVDKAQYIYDQQTGAPDSTSNSVMLLWSLRDLQQSQRQYAAAKAEFEGNKKQLERHDTQIKRSDLTRRPMKSPISGTIMEAAFQQGQLVYEDDTIYKIVDLSRVWVRAEIFEVEISKVQKARKAKVLTVAFPEEPFSGRLVQVSPRVKEPGRTLEVFFEVLNPHRKLKIGMLANVIIKTTGTQ